MMNNGIFGKVVRAFGLGGLMDSIRANAKNPPRREEEEMSGWAESMRGCAPGEGKHTYRRDHGREAVTSRKRRALERSRRKEGHVHKRRRSKRAACKVRV